MHTLDLPRDDTREAMPRHRRATPARRACTARADASWLQRVEAAAHPQPKLNIEVTDPKAVQYKFVYVMAPTSGGRHVALCLCKARLRPNGEVAAASPVSEVFSLLSAPPAYLEGDDEDLVRFFIAMRSGAARRAAARPSPRARSAPSCCEMLLRTGQAAVGEFLGRHGEWPGLSAAGRPGARKPTWSGATKAAPPARLVRWSRPSGATHTGADQIDYMLPTDPPWYIDNLSCGAAGAEPRRRRHFAGRPAGAGGASAGADRQRQETRVATAAGAWPAATDAAAAAADPAPARRRQAAAPPAARQRARWPTAPRQRWHDYAVLSFDYDGERVSFDPAQRVVRQVGDVTEVIAARRGGRGGRAGRA